MNTTTITLNGAVNGVVVIVNGAVVFSQLSEIPVNTPESIAMKYIRGLKNVSLSIQSNNGRGNVQQVIGNVSTGSAAQIGQVFNL